MILFVKLVLGYKLIHCRTLSKRQRSLLEAYADDVENRHSSTQVPNSSDQATKNSNQTAKGSEDPLVDDGKAYFTHSPPFSGWLSKGWQNIRERFGF